MSEIATGEIKFNELPKFSEVNQTSAKSTTVAKPSKGDKVSDQEKLRILKEEKEKAETGLAKDTEDLARTTDENYRKKLQASIPQYIPDINSLNKEIASITGEPVAEPGIINWKNVPKYNSDKDQATISDKAIAAGAGALGGALYGAYKKLAPSESSLAARLMERYYGLPSGALTTFEGSLPTPVNEASIAAARAITAPPPVAANVAGEAGVLPTSSRVEPSFSSTPKAPSSAYMGAGEGPTQVYNYALSLGLSPTQAMQAVDNTKEEGGAHYIKGQARAGELKAQKMFPAGVTVLPEAPNVVVPIPTGGGSRQQYDVWRRPRAIGPMPWVSGAQPSVIENMGDVRPGAAPTAPMPPTEPALQQPTIEETAAKIRAASARAHALQRGANVAVRGLFGAPLAAQAYGMATQKEPIDWTQVLSLGGNALGTFGPLTSKVPFVGRIPVAGPLATLAQIPYAVKHREEILRGLTKADINPNAPIPVSEMLEPAFPVDNR